MEQGRRWCGSREVGGGVLRERSKVCKAGVLLLCQILAMHSQRTGGGSGGGGVTSGQQPSGVPRPKALTTRLTE